VTTIDETMLRRVYSEFLEMPGLRPTLEQAQLLFGMDRAACLELLEFLVEAEYLCRSPGKTYGLRDEGAGGKRRRSSGGLRPVGTDSSEAQRKAASHE
jgi:hypothetical protein